MAGTGNRQAQRRPGRAQASRSARASFWILAALIALCAVGGGASQVDVQSLLYVRPAAALALAALVALPGPWNLRPVKTPAFCLAALAVLMLLQLTPLPPTLWTALPGHGRFAAAAGLIGTAQSWQPVSLTPDLGWSSVLDLLVPAAMLIGYARLTHVERRWLLDLFVAVVGFSILLAVLQIATGKGYLYRQTSFNLPVGPFANRNHQAALLAIALPALRVWNIRSGGEVLAAQFRLAAALALAALAVLLAMLTGSRSGLALLVGMLLIAGLIAGMPSLASGHSPSTRSDRRRYRVAGVGIGGGLVLLGALAVATGRSLTLTRLLEANVLTDQRSKAAPVVWRIVRDFFPWGSGFGSFDRAFRIYEPDTLLKGTFFNHAHNDWAELVLTGGLPAAAILLAFLLWWGRHVIAAVRTSGTDSRSQQTILLARVGVAITFGIGLFSLVDYPLRTQLIAALFALGCAWLGSAGEDRRA